MSLIGLKLLYPFFLQALFCPNLWLFIEVRQILTIALPDPKIFYALKQQKSTFSLFASNSVLKRVRQLHTSYHWVLRKKFVLFFRPLIVIKNLSSEPMAQGKLFLC